MKKLLILVVIIAAGYAGYNHFYLNSESYYNEQGMLVLEDGRNELHLAELGDVDVELRVFGATPVNQPAGPAVFITDLILATPMADNEETFNKYLCEKKSADQARFVQLIADQVSVDDIVQEIKGSKERNCVRLKGTSYKIHKSFMDGKDITSGLTVGPSPKSDPYKMVDVTSMEMIPCT